MPKSFAIIRLIFVALFCLADAKNRGLRKVPVWDDLLDKQQKCFLDTYNHDEVIKGQITDCYHRPLSGECDEEEAKGCELSCCLLKKTMNEEESSTILKEVKCLLYTLNHGNATVQNQFANCNDLWYCQNLLDNWNNCPPLAKL
jgi:hypothetical protein